jgi:hypothetical protein
MTQSLKANKAQAHSPSKAETILSDSVKLTLANVTGEASKAFELYAKKQDASIAYETAEGVLTDELYTYVTMTKPDYPTWQAVKKHIINSISASKGRKFDTIEKWFNEKIVKGLKALGYELPKAESKNAESMAKLRQELSSISDNELQAKIEASAKAGDFKKASQLATEKTKREKQAKNAIVKTYKQNVTELKKQIKDKITKFDNDLQLAAMLYAVNNIDEIIKLAKIKS